MTARRLLFFGALLLFLGPCRVHAQTACDAPMVLVSNPAEVVANLEQFDTVVGATPILASVEVAIVPEGQQPGGALTLIARSAWAVATSPPCYRTPLPLSGSLPRNTNLVLYARVVGDAGLYGSDPTTNRGPWSPASNPFVLLSIPTLAAPTAVRVRRNP